MRKIPLILCTLVAATCGLWAESPGPGKQVEQTLSLKNGSQIPFLLYLPKDFESRSGNLPVMLFLHGRGESDGPLSVVRKWGPSRLADRGDFPYVLISPQCPRSESWDRPTQQAALLELLDDIIERFRGDRDKVYLTGLSMGGFGSWRLAADHSDKFAAVVPVCGGGNPGDASKLVPLPIWVWHGTEDKAVPLRRSVEMVEAIQKAGGASIRLTTLESVGHNSWEAAYATPELYEWLNAQTASKNRERTAGGKK
jgi:predicted peptidase